MRKELYLLIGLLLTAAPIARAAANTFSINSTATTNNGPLPVLYTCDGKDISPQLSWKNPPAKTQSYALIMVDTDGSNGGFYHWILYNLPKDTKQLDEGVTKLPPGTLVGTTNFGREQYNGPCPPKGSSHHYVFTLYALDGKLSLPAGEDAQTILAAIKPHVLGSVSYTTIYNRWG